MRYLILPFLLFICSACTSNSLLEKYVNPLIGTDVRIVEGKNKNSTEERGQVIPAVGVPHGMTNWTAQTQSSEQKCHPPYYYYQNTIQGFQASHWMNGSCTQNYGSVTVMPICGKLVTEASERAVVFNHSEENATPSYYSVNLPDYNIFAEITGLSRSGIMRFTYKGAGDRYIVIEPNSDEGIAYIHIDREKKEIIGYNPVHRIYQGYGEKAGFSGYFVIQLNKEIEDCGLWNGDEKISKSNETQGNGKGIGAWLKLDGNSSTNSQTLILKVGTSFTSIENARMNLEAEIPRWNFEEVRKTSSSIWTKELSKIVVTGGDEEDKVQFYSALYRSHFLPRVFSDVDGSYPEFDGGKRILKMESGDYYCDFSEWDTYRAVHPLFTILNPTQDADMAKSLILKGQQGGWLPIFPSWNSYTAAMIGDHCTSMIGDAIMKGITGFDYEAAYSLMRKNAFEVNGDFDSYKNGKGRRALASYLQYGYIPMEDSVKEAFHRNEQVSRTLEYAYDDFVLSQVAKKLGKTDDYNILIKRAKNYQNVIDSKTGYARGRHTDSTWVDPFDPLAFSSFICEGTPFHYTWYVPQDVAGLIDILGGKEHFSARLDKFFEGNYYWHGNEPGHHIAYLYAYSGEPWKTQKIIHEIIKKEYFTTPDGLSGNDDAGQMSAWLVFSMIGFYPVCPGMPYYVIGSPTFEETVLTLEDGKHFTIKANNASAENIYIQSALLNNKPYNKSYILHEDIINGGVLEFEMGSSPNKNWASKEEDCPPSMTM